MAKMDTIFKNVETLFRYVLSGFVALGVAWAVDSNHLVLKDMFESVNSWWPVLLLGPTIGCLIYSVHVTLHFLTRCYRIFDLARGRSGVATVATESNSQAFDKMCIERWRCRSADSDSEKAVQIGLDMWSAKIHFLYCSFWAGLVTPPILGFLGRHLSYVHWIVVLVISVVVLVIALWDNYRQTTFQLVVQARASSATQTPQNQTPQAGS